MADEQKDTQKSLEVPSTESGESPTSPPSQSSTLHDEGTTTAPTQPVETEGRGAPALHRAGTLPPQAGHIAAEHINADLNRRRGRTISARPKNLEGREQSPRSQLFNRPSGRGRNSSGREGSMEPIPENRQQATSRPRGSTNSERPSFTSPGMRPRMSTWAVGPAPARQRGSTLTRRPTILVNPPAMTTGRDMDAQSVNFTLAGQAVDTVAANQPYVDPGYADLNPAYDQPVNSRPVWGLAKPLPRVIRPGMVPTRSELKLQIPDAEQQKQDEANIDLEQGRVENTLNINKLSPMLQQARQQRENRLFQTMSRGHSIHSNNSPLGQKPSSVLSPSSQVIEEGDEHPFPKPHSDLAPVLEQPTPGPTRPGSPTTAQPLEIPNNWLPDDASSILTAKEEDPEEDNYLSNSWIDDSAPLRAYDPDTDEIHNLHTHWSVIRLKFREPLAELLAVTVQLTLGFCADLVVTTSSNKAGNEATTDWAWGLATMVGIYIAGGISGAHLNPAISIMLWIYRGFPLRKVPVYIAAQILGAFLAGLIAFGLYQKNIIAYGGSDLGASGTLADFITYPRYEWIDAPTAFFTEFTATAILAVAVLALGDDTNAPPGAGMNAFVLGLIITVLSMAFGYNTGAAMNPARDLGPRLALWVVGYGGSNCFGLIGGGRLDFGYFVYGPWVGTILGAVVGAFLYDVCIFVGGESPVNYPRERMERAGRKWRRRWVGRLRKGRGRGRGSGSGRRVNAEEKEGKVGR